MGDLGYLFTPSGINKHIHSNKNPKKMKKVFAILAVVAFVACNSGENKDVTKDTPAVAPAPTETTPDAPAIDAPMEVPNPSEKGEVEVDITDLVNSTKDTKDKIEGTNELLNSLISKFDELETRMTSFDEILNRIDKIEQDFEKRLPTPVEKLEMRSMDSYPYSVKLSDFWSEEVDSIDGEEKTQGEEYILTPEDVKKDYNASTIKTSFNVQKPEDQDFQR
jgi:hypothetical protein